MRSALLKGALWVSVTKLAVNAIGLLSTIVLARLLLPEDFGLVAIASSTSTIFAAITELSLSQALIQNDDLEDDHFHTAFTLDALRGVLLAAAMICLSWPLAVGFDEPRLLGLMLAFAGANFIGCFANPRLALLERQLEFKQWVVLSGGEKLAGFITSACVAFIYETYWALALGAVASQLMRVASSYILISYKPRITLSKSREIVSFSAWLLFSHIAQSITWRADPLIYAAFMSNKTIGFFTIGVRISSLMINEVLAPISHVLFPAFARMRAEPVRLRAAYLRAQGLVCLIAMPIGFGLAATAEQLIIIVLGKTWLPAAAVVQILAIGFAIQRTNELNAIAMATSNTKALFGRDIRALGIRIPLVLGGLIYAPQLGMSALFGALAGDAVSIVTNSILNMQLVSRVSLVSVRDQLMLIWRPALASVVMAAAVLAIAGLAQDDRIWVAIVFFLLSVGSGFVVYVSVLAGLWLLAGRPPSAEAELIGLIQKRVIKRFA